MNLRVRRLWRFYARFAAVLLFAFRDGYWSGDSARRSLGGNMGFLDKLFGRGKKEASDVTADASKRAEGTAQEAKGAAQDQAASLEDKAQDAAQDAREKL
jgi:uncharacterized protein YjbJ (UPF0337 family)